MSGSFTPVPRRWIHRPKPRTRLPFALGVSVVLHAAMLRLVPGPVQDGRANAQPAALTVEIAAAEAVPAAPSEAAYPPERRPAFAENLVVAAPERAGFADEGHPHGAQYRVEFPAPPAAAPRYYGLREIDVFPEPVVPLQMPQASAGAAAPEPVRMEVFIDAQGVVTDVAVRESGASSGTLAAARKSILAARFRPARRAGHAVASRIEIELRGGGEQDPVVARSR